MISAVNVLGTDKTVIQNFNIFRGSKLSQSDPRHEVGERGCLVKKYIMTVSTLRENCSDPG